MCKVQINEQLNGIEVIFDSKPEQATLRTLKGSGFRWHNKKKLWYAKNTPERLEIATGLENGVVIETAPTEKPKTNKFGVKVGDIFYSSWGYEQTNVNFFQVIALAGTQSVRVREVHPPMVEDQAVSAMASDRTYKMTSELLPASDFSVFIKDQEKGDLKRLKSYSADGVSNPQFTLDSFANAYYCGSDTIKTYESWYY